MLHLSELQTESESDSLSLRHSIQFPVRFARWESLMAGRRKAVEHKLNCIECRPEFEQSESIEGHIKESYFCELRRYCNRIRSLNIKDYAGP